MQNQEYNEILKTSFFIFLSNNYHAVSLTGLYNFTKIYANLRKL